MPQLNKGGKYVFGWSVIGAEGTIHFPTMALSEYNLTSEPEIIIFTGSKITGGFCVTNQRMLASSKLKHIIDDLPGLTGEHSGSAASLFHIREEAMRGFHYPKKEQCSYPQKR